MSGLIVLVKHNPSRQRCLLEILARIALQEFIPDDAAASVCLTCCRSA